MQPVLQGQSGSYVGTMYDSNYNEYMIGFDGGGNLLWMRAE